MIPYGRQSLDEDDISAVVDVLRGDWLTQGPHVDEFERALADAVGARHAVAFANGTAALHAAASAAGLGPGDVLVTSPLSFAASAACATYVGASPSFVDIDPATWNLDVAVVPTTAAAVVPVHFAGLPVDLTALTHRPRVVIEDAAHALGAMTPDGPVGGCARSDMCCFSFHPVKAITTGEGGAVTTNDDHLAGRLRTFRHHGIVRAPDDGAWAYGIPEVGFNYRLTDIQAALGTSQLAKLERFVKRRQDIAGRYRELLADLPVELPPAAPPGYTHAHHLFPVVVADRRRVFDAMRAAGIGVQVHYVPIYQHAAYAGPAQAANFPVTERVYAGLISLPIFPDLTDAEQDRVVAELRACVAP